jgi:hypothetical protein
MPRDRISLPTNTLARFNIARSHGQLAPWFCLLFSFLALNYACSYFLKNSPIFHADLPKLKDEDRRCGALASKMLAQLPASEIQVSIRISAHVHKLSLLVPATVLLV